jgi:YidC/Oxa1 family membrane protein insertase
MNLFGGIAYLFTIVFYQPLLNALILLYMYFPGRDFGVAIVVLTVLIRLLLYPLLAESIRVQRVTSQLQPQIKEIQEKYKHDKEQQAVLQMKLLKDNNVNVFNGFFVTLVQLPILIALYQVFIHGLQASASGQLYAFVANPGVVNPMFLHLIDLSKPSPLMVLAAGALQFFQSKMFYPQQKNSGASPESGQMQATMQRQFLYLLPVMTIVIFWNFPAALSLYWVVTSICAIIQQKIIFKKLAQKSPTPIL